MSRYLLAATFADGEGVPPMTEWTPEEVQAHLDYYSVLNTELTASGGLIETTILTGPDLAVIVTGDGQPRTVHGSFPGQAVRAVAHSPPIEESKGPQPVPRWVHLADTGVMPGMPRQAHGSHVGHTPAINRQRHRHSQTGMP